MPNYIDRDAFEADCRERYCNDCDRRKGMKNGKLKVVYEIGDAPCRSCGIEDILDDLLNAPVADVVKRTPKPKPPKRLPCTCGRKQLEMWFDATGHTVYLRCPVCGMQSPKVKYQTQLNKAWNDTVNGIWG